MAAVLGFQVDQKVLLALLVGAVGLFVAWWRSVTSWEKIAGSYAKTLPPGKWGLPYIGEFLEFMFTQKYNHGQFVEKRKAMYALNSVIPSREFSISISIVPLAQSPCTKRNCDDLSSLILLED